MFQDCLVAHYWSDVVLFGKALCVIGFIWCTIFLTSPFEYPKAQKIFVWGLWIFCILFFIFVPNPSVILNGCPRGFF